MTVAEDPKEIEKERKRKQRSRYTHSKVLVKKLWNFFIANMEEIPEENRINFVNSITADEKETLEYILSDRSRIKQLLDSESEEI